MITVPEALSIIEQNTSSLEPVRMPLVKSVGMVLAHDLIAPISLPSFRQAAMDGYAFRHGFGDRLNVIGEIKAGDDLEYSLQQTDAIRIFTGSKVPDQADTVIVQEHVARVGNQIKIVKMPKVGSNLRPVGEQVQSGETVLRRGTVVTPSVLGFLAGLGISEVLVIRKPKISLIATGSELQNAGEPLRPGAVYECNLEMLKAAVNSESVEQISSVRIQDDPVSTVEAIQDGLSSDLLLITGGVSVGDYDFVRSALEEVGAEEKFYRVDQKPGKPVWFGKKGTTLIFALPGNPAATFTCFLAYVLAALHQLGGKSQASQRLKKGVFLGTFSNQRGKAQFVMGNESGGFFEPLPGGEKRGLLSFASSNAILFVPGEIREIRHGDPIQFISISR